MTLQFYNEKVFILGSANRLPPLANTWSHSALKLGKCRIGDIFKLEKHVDFSFWCHQCIYLQYLLYKFGCFVTRKWREYCNSSSSGIKPMHFPTLFLTSEHHVHLVADEIGSLLLLLLVYFFFNDTLYQKNFRFINNRSVGLGNKKIYKEGKKSGKLFLKD